jgi:hypothetical protein
MNEEGIVLSADLAEVIDALGELRAAERALDAARDEVDAKAVRLAEIVGTRRRDKDTAFEAEHDAERLIVGAALAARRWRIDQLEEGAR